MSSEVHAFDAMIINEGGFVLHNVPGDRGGMTYAGIARKFNPNWPGWTDIDNGRTPKTSDVREFYRVNYWEPISGDSLPQPIAQTIFDFAVNAGVKTAAKLAQAVVGMAPDGVIGPKSIAALSQIDPGQFILLYTIAKIKRYADICNNDRSQSKFLLGWINRTLKGLSDDG